MLLFCALFSDTLRGVLSRCNNLMIASASQLAVVETQHVGPMLRLLSAWRVIPMITINNEFLRERSTDEEITLTDLTRDSQHLIHLSTYLPSCFCLSCYTDLSSKDQWTICSYVLFVCFDDPSLEVISSDIHCFIHSASTVVVTLCLVHLT